MFEKINSTYYADYPNLQINFEPNITWNAKNKKVMEANSVKTANAWREAKLAEYYMKKAKQL